MDPNTASLSDLAAELEKADVAIVLGINPRKWRAYRRNLLAAIDRLSPVPADCAGMTDADLLRALES